MRCDLKALLDGLRRAAFVGFVVGRCGCIAELLAFCGVDGDAAGLEVLGDVESFFDGVDVVLSAAECHCGAAVEGHPVGVESAVADLQAGFRAGVACGLLCGVYAGAGGVESEGFVADFFVEFE